KEIECTVPGAAYDDATNLVTVTTLCWSGDAFEGYPRSILRPDGTATIYSYSRDGNNQTTVESTGAPNGSVTQITDGKRISVVKSAAGYIVSETVADITSGLTLSTKTTTDSDIFGRPSTFTYDDGTTESIVEGCCGPTSMTDRTGSVTNVT